MQNDTPRDQLAAASFHHQVRNVLSRLQLALELFEADAPLSEIQRALLSMALRAASDLDTMFCDPAADARLLQAIRRSPTGNGTVESAYPAEALPATLPWEPSRGLHPQQQRCARQAAGATRSTSPAPGPRRS